MSPERTLANLHFAPPPWVQQSVNGFLYAAAMVSLAVLAAWVAAPSKGYALGPAEAELATSSIGPLAVGMPVELRGAGSERRTGEVVKFIRRDDGVRAVELAVVRWSEPSFAAESVVALTALEAVTQTAPQLASRR